MDNELISNKEIGTYLLHNPETKETYVGSGILADRKAEHFRELSKNEHVNHKLQSAFNRNPNFDFIAVPMENRDVAFDFEQVIINEHWGNPLFLNLSANARSCSVEVTPETRAKMSKASLGRNVGLKRSPECIDANRQRNLGKKQSQETIEKRVSQMRGVARSPEIIEKVRQTLFGREHSEESKAKMSESAIARGYSENAISGMKKAVSKSVVVDGVVYESASAAARKYGIGPGTALDRVRSDRFSNWTFNKEN